MKPVAYEGTEPYIFASYAHKDSEQVMHVLSELQSRGYRLWYDDGIAPGSEWPEDIAQHLDGASLVMAFITPNSMASQNCRREITFSLSREKPFLSVLLEPTEMPLGMEMQLSAQQMIVRENYNSWDGFMRKIMRCPDLEPCRAHAGQPDEEAPAQEEEAYPKLTENAQVPSQMAFASNHKADAVQKPTESTAKVLSTAQVPAIARENGPTLQSQTALVPNEGRAPQPQVTTTPQASNDERDGDGAKKAPNLKVLIPVIALVFTALLVFLSLGLKKPGDLIAFSWGDTLAVDQQRVINSSKTITQDDLEAIASLRNLSSLDLDKCDFSACDFSQVSFASQSLEKVNLEHTTGINDFSFLKSQPLTELDVSGCQEFKSLEGLQLQDLTTLDVADTGVQDLSPLAEAPVLATLDVADTGVQDLEPIGHLPSLTSIRFANTAVSDLTPLAKIETLESIDGSGSAVTSLDTLVPLASLTSLAFDDCQLKAPSETLVALRLSSVHLARTGISDFSFLTNCTILNELDLSGNPSLTDISWFDSQNLATLMKLDLSQTGLNRDSLTWVSACPMLKKLSLDGISLGNLELCRGLEDLQTLSAANCDIEAIGALETCPALDVILLGHNKIADVSPLAALSSIDSSRTIIDLSHNALTSVEALPDGNYRALMLEGNAQDIGGSLRETQRGYEIVLPWYDGMQNSTFATTHGFSRVYLLDCPQNQILAMEGTLGSGRVVFIDADELRTLYETDGFEYPLNLGSDSHSSSSGDGNFSISETITYEMEPISIGNSEG